MRRVVSIILILTLTSPVFFIYLNFWIRQNQIRKEIRHSFCQNQDKDELILLKVPIFYLDKESNDFKKTREDEFCYKGEMYDIVRQEKHDNEIWFWCIMDHEESMVLAELERLVRKAMDQDPSTQKQTQQILHLLFSLYIDQSDNQVVLYHGATWHSIYDTFSMVTWDNSPPSPPPKA